MVSSPIDPRLGPLQDNGGPTFTQALVTEYNTHKVPLTYKTYAGLNHGGVVTSAKPGKDGSAFIKKAFK